MWWPNLRKNQTRLSGGLFPFQTECILEFFFGGGGKSINQAIKILELTHFIHFAVLYVFIVQLFKHWKHL